MKIIMTCAAGAALLATLAAPAQAMTTCKPGKEDHRICFVAYNPNDVTLVYGILRSMTLLEFGKDETNPRLVAANTKDLDFIPDHNTLIIKPLPVSTAAWHVQPITILTTLPDGSVRIYPIEYDLLDQGPITEDNTASTFKISFTYPQDEAAAKAAAWRQRQAALQMQAVKDKLATTGPGSASGLNGYSCDYVEQHDPKKGRPNFIPTRVCDDGQTTYMWFPGNMVVPAISLDGPDKKPTVPMQNFDSTGSYQVIHQVAQHFYLRYGDVDSNVVCIWKTGKVDPVGYNPGTNTSSRDVERVVKGSDQ